jgi:integrase
MQKTPSTRAARGSGTIRQRKDGRWEARYTVGRNPGTGKQIQRSIYGESKKEVLEQLQRTQVDITEGIYQNPSKLTVSQWLDIWLVEYNKEIKPRTLDLYKGQVNYRIKPGIGFIKLSALDPHEIQKFLNQQGEDLPDKAALSPKSIKNLYGILHKALQQAVELGYMRNNPSDICKLPRVTKPNIKPLDAAQISEFLKRVKGHPFEMLYTVTLFTGIRQGEALGLTWDCIQENTILIYRQLQRIKGEHKFSSPKNNKTRRITPAPALMRLLEEHRRGQEARSLELGPLWENDNGFVFTDEFGKHLTSSSVSQPFKRIVAELGIPDTRFHDMRHSYAVAALQAGDDIKTVQENLGHHTAAFTLDVYGHVTNQMKLESAARMDRFFNSVASS